MRWSSSAQPARLIQPAGDAGIVRSTFPVRSKTWRIEAPFVVKPLTATLLSSGDQPRTCIPCELSPITFSDQPGWGTSSPGAALETWLAGLPRDASDEPIGPPPA